MALDAASEFIRDELEAATLFDGRYSNIVLANYDSVADEKRGCFSLVFRAYDNALNRTVALKFLEPIWIGDDYRRTAFRREHSILNQLLTVDRCMQLTAGLRTATFPIPISGRGPIPLPCEYFAVEWLDGELDDFFLGKASADSIDRLRLFNEIVLAIAALHSHEVFHRDLKQDNIRSYEESLRRVVVAIDLGTAARFDSGPIGTPYTRPVGASGYAAPEAVCKLAGNRILARFTDIYALGCLLFELFNPGYFFRALENANPRYKVRLAAMAGHLTSSPDQAIQVSEWESALAKLGSGVARVSIDGPGSDVPPAVAGVLNEILFALTSFDYRNRPRRLDWVRQKIWVAIKVLENEKAQRVRIEAARIRRARRAAKVAAKMARLAQGNKKQEITAC